MKSAASTQKLSVGIIEIIEVDKVRVQFSLTLFFSI